MFIYILSAILIAVIISGIQYLYKNKQWLLFIIRSVVYFLLFLLILNPNITQKKKNLIKPELLILADQTKSIAYLKKDKLVSQIIDSIEQEKIKSKFNIVKFGFTNTVYPLKNFSYTSNKTNISKILTELSELYNVKYKTPVILITDGNSNQGKSYPYIFNKDNSKLEIYPVILGDTVKFNNLQVEQINVNPIAFKGNNFPVEFFLNYNGKENIKTKIKILKNNKTIYQKNISFSKEKKSIIVHLKLKAEKLGINKYKVELQSFPNEKNKRDNIKYFFVEVLKQNKKIAIISNIIHPDLGAIKQSLSKNKYIKTDILRPDKKIDINKYTSIILYQPDSDFSNIFSNKKLSKINWFIITGLHTDWNWLNKQKLFFNRKISTTTEEYFPEVNSNFSLFKLPELHYTKLPPLQDKYGKIKYSQANIAVYSKIKRINTQEPLLMFNNSPKQAVLFGENLWQWEIYCGKQKKQQEFINLIQNIIQYISLQKKHNKIQLNYKKQFEQSDKVQINAIALNENYGIDTQAQLKISLYKNKKMISSFPMTSEGESYKAEFDNLSPGNYSFTVLNNKTKKKRKGNFSITNSELELTKNSADKKSLAELAENTGGKIFFPDKINKLIKKLTEKNIYPAHIIVNTEKYSLINYKNILFSIILLLGIEWFLKKIQGKL